MLRKLAVSSVLLGMLASPVLAKDQDGYAAKYGRPTETDKSKTQETMYWHNPSSTLFATFRQDKLFTEGRIYRCGTLKEQRKVLLQQIAKYTKQYGLMQTKDLGVRGAYEFIFHGPGEMVVVMATEDMLHTVIVITKKSGERA